MQQWLGLRDGDFLVVPAIMHRLVEPSAPWGSPFLVVLLLLRLPRLLLLLLLVLLLRVAGLALATGTATAVVREQN